MKQLKARRSVGVATALSLSLLGSLSCAAVASADEGPEPATTTSVSASPEAESTTPLLQQRCGALGLGRSGHGCGGRGLRALIGAGYGRARQ